MKKALNHWMTQIVLTAITSFLFNGGGFADKKVVYAQKVGGMDIIKQSIHNPTAILVYPVISQRVHQHLRQGNHDAGQPKGQVDSWSHSRSAPGTIPLSPAIPNS